MTEVRFESSRYELINSLGAGAMGTVHRVLDRLSGQVLTLKRVQVDSDALEWGGLPAGDDTTGIKIAFAREFQLLASLRHPHIISVVDFGWDQDEVPFFTMDLQENAQTILQAARDQPTTVQVAMLAQLLQALNYLHTQGIVHRDLKPDNVIVNRGQSVFQK